MTEHAEGAGRALPPTSAFAGDDGTAPPGLAAALARTDPQQRLEAVVEALRTERVLVPVVAGLDERHEAAEPGQVVGEKSAHAAMVTVAAPDGRAVMPVFSSIAALQAWRAEARPVPVEGRRAALAAGSEADGLLVLDAGSTAPVQVPRPAVRAIALGEPWVPAARNPEVREAVHATLAQVPGVRGAAVEPGRATEITAVVHLTRQPTGPDAETVATLRACQAALADSQTIYDLVDSIAVRPAITH